MENYEDLQSALKAQNRIVFHEGSMFLEKGKFDRSEDFHPKPSATLNAERTLIVMEIFTIISQGAISYKGIVFNNLLKASANKSKKNSDGSISYSEQRDILHCGYMSEYGRQVCTYGGNTKQEIIEKFMRDFQ